MSLWLSLSFVLLLIALLVLFQIDAAAIRDFAESRSRPSLQRMAATRTPGKIKSYVTHIRVALQATGQTAATYTLFFACFVLILVGLISGVSFGNPYLVPLLAAALAAIPLLYVRVQYRDYRQLMLDELDTSLSIITSSYERTENIIEAFAENVEYVNEPLKGVFQKFLFSVRSAGIPLPAAIDQMKDQVLQSSFTSWCDNLKRCINDRSLKSSLTPFVDDVTDIQEERSKAKTLLYDSQSEFIGVLVVSALFMALKYLALPAFLPSEIPQGVSAFLMALDVFLAASFSLKVYFWVTDLQFDE